MNGRLPLRLIDLENFLKLLNASEFVAAVYCEDKYKMKYRYMK